MVSKAIRWLAGTSNDATAWDALFKDFNKTHGRGEVGYRQGEPIALKLNLNNSDMTWGNAQNVAPQVLRALLWQLVNQAGVTNQADITVCDPSRIIGQPIWDICQSAFPHVRFVDSSGGNGRIQAQADTNASAAIHFGNPNVWGNGARYPATVFTEATYIINLGLLRGHSLAGLTACAKNWFGATWVNFDTGAFHRGWTPGGPDAMNGLHGFVAVNDFNAGGNWVFTQRPMGSDSPLVDLMGHKDLGGKTLLYLVDGLYATTDQNGGVPFKWQSQPFNQHWSSSLFASQDGVAIDSVCLDFLRAEAGYTNTVKGTVDNYLHEAAQANNPPSGTVYDPERDGTRLPSLGVHEHWNNATDKLYSRNLGKANGIELVSSHPILTIVGNSPGQFGFIVNGPPGETCVVERSSDLRAWVGWMTNTAPFTNFDSTKASSPHRYYRARNLP
jgi:uncharacterized protein (DUF362 family)